MAPRTFQERNGNKSGSFTAETGGINRRRMGDGYGRAILQAGL